MQKVIIVTTVGTRPEAIKMAPVILELQKQDWCKVIVLATAQHREMLDQVLNLFGIEPQFDLNVMRPNQSLNGLSSTVLTGIDTILGEVNPDLVLTQGDTTTVLMTALAAFHRQITLGHVEAGLRSGNMQSPFPEEMNRIVATRLADFHFAPTQTAVDALLAEGTPKEKVFLTGNTVIDALVSTTQKDIRINVPLNPDKKLILLTAHRRENHGVNLQAIFMAAKKLADERTDIEILYPVHPNPNVKDMAYALLAHHPRIHLVAPLEYGPMVQVLKQAYFILTDSGGIQEEAPFLGKPVLVLRQETERPEAVNAGVAKLVKLETAAIYEEACTLLDDQNAYAAMARGISPYGDGKAAKRIAHILKNYFIQERGNDFSEAVLQTADVEISGIL